MSVRPQKFFRFQRNLTVDRGRWMIHEGMLMTRSKVKEIWNVRKWPISEDISSTSVPVIKWLLVNYDTARPHRNYNRTDFDRPIRPRSASRDLQTWPADQYEFCLLWPVDRQSNTGLIYCVCVIVNTYNMIFSVHILIIGYWFSNLMNMSLKNTLTDFL